MAKVDNDDCAIVIFIGFSKTFDTVNHDIFLGTICRCGIMGNDLSFFESYLFR